MRAEMMGRRNQGQSQLFYEFRLDEVVPDDHLVRRTGWLIELSWVYEELAPYYSEIGRPSIDPGPDDPDADHRLRLRDPPRNDRSAERFRSISLIDGSAIWGWRRRSPTTRRSPVRGMNGSVRATSSGVCSSVSWETCIQAG